MVSNSAALSTANICTPLISSSSSFGGRQPQLTFGTSINASGYSLQGLSHEAMVLFGQNRRRECGHELGRLGNRSLTRRANNPALVVASLQAYSPQLMRWAVRLVGCYALFKAISRSSSGSDPPSVQLLQGFIGDLVNGNSKQGSKSSGRRSTASWHTSVKGTLVRKLRVPSISQGRKLLQSISALLSEDDLFIDVASHKGCQVRRESAHSQSVCCCNVRALFDELPTPHVSVEITTFPQGPLTALEYEKAEKIERLLKGGRSI